MRDSTNDIPIVTAIGGDGNVFKCQRGKHEIHRREASKIWSKARRGWKFLDKLTGGIRWPVKLCESLIYFQDMLLKMNSRI